MPFRVKAKHHEVKVRFCFGYLVTNSQTCTQTDWGKKKEGGHEVSAWYSWSSAYIFNVFYPHFSWPY